MSYSGLLIAFATAAGLVGGCASAGSAIDETVDAPPGSPQVYAPPGTTIDAPLTPAIDAPITPAIDAPGPCTVTTTNLLVNPSFDATPIGTGWTQAPIDAAYPIITSDWPAGRATEQGMDAAPCSANAQTTRSTRMSPCPRARPSSSSPATTRFRTQELGGVYDRAKIQLVQTGGTLIEEALAKTNSNATTAWTAFQFTFATPHAGETVRLRLSTASDSTDSTSFFFDSLALTATVCQ